MLNNEKVKIMTNLSVYESKDGKEDIQISQYYRTDYVRLEVIRTIVSVTIAYLLILVLVGVYQSEYLIREAVKLDYTMIATYVIGIYVMLLAIYVAITMVVARMRYRKARVQVSKYNKGLKLLRKIYKEEQR